MIGAGNRGGKGISRSFGYPMLSLFDEMNRLFEDALPAAESARSVGGFNPRIDVTETDKEYVIRGEFPGLESSEISLELRDNSIILSGEKRATHEEKDGEKLRVERSFGAFSRAIQFPLEVDEDNATAEMKSGVLTVKVPKSAKVLRGTKKLSIKAGN